MLHFLILLIIFISASFATEIEDASKLDVFLNDRIEIQDNVLETSVDIQEDNPDTRVVDGNKNDLKFEENFLNKDLDSEDGIEGSSEILHEERGLEQDNNQDTGLDDRSQVQVEENERLGDDSEQTKNVSDSAARLEDSLNEVDGKEEVVKNGDDLPVTQDKQDLDSESTDEKPSQSLKTIGETENKRFADYVILRALDKITGKTFELKAKTNESVVFERLEILPLKCWKSYPEELPENKLLLKLFEKRKGRDKDLLFYGWIFSSTPGISGLEHPTYDITLKDCTFTQNDTDN